MSTPAAILSALATLIEDRRLAAAAWADLLKEEALFNAYLNARRQSLLAQSAYLDDLSHVEILQGSPVYVFADAHTTAYEPFPRTSPFPLRCASIDHPYSPHPAILHLFTRLPKNSTSLASHRWYLPSTASATSLRPAALDWIHKGILPALPEIGLNGRPLPPLSPSV